MDEEIIKCCECGDFIELDEPRALHDLCNSCHEADDPEEFEEFMNR
ncbi:hypothetical protein [Moritella sp. JT01]|nr:hypothetical protein [Moritella sp. JT01]